MLLTITTTHFPATDLGYLLHKNPARVQSVELSAGKAHIFYPEATQDRCTAALLLDIDPVGLVRNTRGPAGDNFALEQYVNDRPYVASSFMSVALSKAFSTAMNGICKDRPELVEQPLPLEVTLSVLPAQGGEAYLRRLFEPLSYQIQAEGYPLDEHFPEWGQSRYFIVTFRHRVRLRELLTHLYVLIPVLDNDKHYSIREHEVEKLLAKGAGWLQTHPEREGITRRYLKNLGALTRQAFASLEESEPEEEDGKVPEEIRAKRQSLHLQRLERAFEALKASGAKRVLDLGCGEGKLLRLLLRDRQFETILGMDVSARSLEMARENLKLDRLPEREMSRIGLIQGIAGWPRGGTVSGRLGLSLAGGSGCGRGSGTFTYRRPVRLKGNFQQTTDVGVFVRLRVRINPVHQMPVFHPGVGTKQPVPVRKDIAIVSIGQGQYVVVVHVVHIRCDHHQTQ
jgi:3' terminal RNA ribose 2'-O-methyltransferase Hen1